MTLEATNDEKDITMAGVGVSTGGNVVGSNFFFATPTRTGKAMTLGIHAILANLFK